MPYFFFTASSACDNKQHSQRSAPRSEHARGKRVGPHQWLLLGVRRDVPPGVVARELLLRRLRRQRTDPHVLPAATSRTSDEEAGEAVSLRASRTFRERCARRAGHRRRVPSRLRYPRDRSACVIVTIRCFALAQKGAEGLPEAGAVEQFRRRVRQHLRVQRQRPGSGR